MIEVIPAIDIIEGKLVRLSKGDFASKTVYSDDPVATARQFEEIGIKRLHLVDLDGARLGEIQNLLTLKSICGETGLKVDFGGGVKTESDIESVFEAGASFVGIGSIAATNPPGFGDWMEKFGGGKILLGADVLGESIAINGWQTKTQINIFEFLESFSNLGGKTAFVTDIGKDGMLDGVSTDLYKRIRIMFPDLNLIASGGVSSIEDILALEDIGCSGVIVGKAIYEQKITLNELEGLAKRRSD